MTLGLVAIVRNEAAVLPRLLANVRGGIHWWTICDTGSTDGTQALILNALAGVPGELHERPWVSFGHNQTEMLRYARGKADYLVHLGADETLDGAVRLDALTEPSYALTIKDGGPLFATPRLFRSDLDWRYVGAAHAYLTAPQEPIPGRTLLDGLEVIHHGDGNRRRTGTRFEQTRALLEREYALEPTNPRTVYYLANTYRDLGRMDDALPLYWLRAALGGWQAEADNAREQAERIEAGDGRRVGVPSLT